MHHAHNEKMEKNKITQGIETAKSRKESEYPEKRKNYKHLVILEASIIKQAEMKKKKIRKEYLRRNKKASQKPNSAAEISSKRI